MGIRIPSLDDTRDSVLVAITDIRRETKKNERIYINFVNLCINQKIHQSYITFYPIISFKEQI